MTNVTENTALNADDFNPVDMRPLREQDPHIYHEPLIPYLGSIGPNNLVQLLFECADGREIVHVIVERVDGDIFIGVVDCVPELVPLAWGDTVVFGLHHVLDLNLKDFSVRLSSVREITAAINNACQPLETRPDGALAAFKTAGTKWMRMWQGAPSADQPNEI